MVAYMTMTRKAKVGLLAGCITLGSLAGIGVASATGHLSYPRVGGSCKKGYHGVTAKHNVVAYQLQKNGKLKKIIVSRRYVECVWTAPVMVIQKPTVTTTVAIPPTTAPALPPVAQPPDTTTTTLAPVPTTIASGGGGGLPVPVVTTTQPVVASTTTSTTVPVVTTTSTTSTTTTSTSTTTTTLAPQTIHVTVTMECSGGSDDCTLYNSSAETTAAYTNIYAGAHNDDESPGAGTVSFYSFDNKLICSATVWPGIASNNGRCMGGNDGGPYEGPISALYSGATVYDASTNTTTIYSSASTTGHSN